MNVFGSLIESVTRHRGVTACLIVSEDDGIVVDGTAHIGVKTAAFAALAASLFRKAGRATLAAGLGGVGVFDLEAENGRMIAAGQNGLVVVVVTDTRVNLGLIRVELLRAVATL